MAGDEAYDSAPREFDEHGRAPGAGWRHRREDLSQVYSRDGLDADRNAYDGPRFEAAHTVDYAHMAAARKDGLIDDVAARRRERLSATADTARSRFDDYDKQTSKSRDYRECGDDPDRRFRSKGHEPGAEDASGRRTRRSKSRDRDRDHDGDRRDHDGDRRERDRCRDRERRSRRDESGYGNERDYSEYRPRRRSRSRDRDRSQRDRRYRDSDRDRRHRDSDRDDGGRYRRDHDRDRGERETSSKELPWVPPPLPEHLRHLQVQWALTPVAATATSSAPPLAPVPPQQLSPPLPPPVQNQFENDGSFMEMFRQRMQQQKAFSITSEDSSASEGPSLSGSVVGALSEVTKAPAAAVVPAASNSSGLPVIAKRRISKILKTGIVQKKKKEEEEEVEDKGSDGGSSYMKEVQKYRANKCIENEASRPPLVK